MLVKRIFVLLIFHMIPVRSVAGSGAWLLQTDPANLELITEHQTYTINLILNSNGSTCLNYPSEEVFFVSVSVDDEVTLNLSDSIIPFRCSDILERLNQTLTVTGNVIGYVDLTFRLIVPSRSDPIPLIAGYRVTVVRQNDLWDKIFTIFIGTLAAVNSVNMGCALNLNVVRQILARPIGPAVGFVSQFSFMPLFSLAMSQLFIKHPLKGFGLLVMGVCPGGIASNFWTLLLDGDVNLSITMTFISSVFAMGMMPLWLWLLSGYFPSLSIQGGTTIKVPYVEMAVSLTMLTIPLGVGLLIRRLKPNAAIFISTTIIKPFCFICILLMFGLGFYTLSYIFILMEVHLVAAGLGVAAAGFTVGGFLAWLARLNRAQITAVSLETAMQNGNVAFVLLKMSLPPPYADIAALAPITQILMTSCILYTLFFFHSMHRCYKKRKMMSIDSGEKEMEVVKTSS